MSTNSLNAAYQASILHLSATITRLAAAYFNGHIAIPTPFKEATLKRSPRYRIRSKISVLVICSLVMTAGLAVLASGVVQENGRYFYIVSVCLNTSHGYVSLPSSSQPN